MSSRSTALRLNFNLQLVPPRWLYFCMFTISGFSGLIYESIWSHYLKLFLGHAAYAQSLVLMRFMGGMAGGAWLASRYSDRWTPDAVPRPSSCGAPKASRSAPAQTVPSYTTLILQLAGHDAG